MAAIKRKKGFNIKFNLTVTGLLGVGVVCFCIFLWMFLLGIWAGQTVLTAGKYEAVVETRKNTGTVSASRYQETCGRVSEGCASS